MRTYTCNTIQILTLLQNTNRNSYESLLNVLYLFIRFYEGSIWVHFKDNLTPNGRHLGLINNRKIRIISLLKIYLVFSYIYNDMRACACKMEEKIQKN